MVVKGGIFLAHLDPLIPVEHCLNTTAFMHALRPECTHLLTAASSKITHHKAQITSNSFLEQTRLTVLKWSPRPPDLIGIQLGTRKVL